MNDEELEMPQNVKHTVKKLWHSIDNQYKRLGIVTVSVIFYTFLSILAPLYSAHIVDLLWNGVKAAIDSGVTFSITWNQCGFEILILFIIYLATYVFYTLQNFLMASFAEKLGLRLREEISQKLNRLPLSYFDKHQPGEILSRATNDLDKMSEALQTGLLKLFTSIGMMIGSVIMMFTFSSLLTGIFLFFIGISILLTNSFTKKTLQYALNRQKAVGDLTAQVEESYSGRIIIKSFNQEEKSLQDFCQITEEVAQTSKKADFITNGINPIIRLVNRVGQAIIAILAGNLLISGKLTVGIFQAFFQYMNQSAEPLTEAAYMINSLQSALASLERVYEILEEEEMIGDSSNPKSIKNARGDISFENVYFGYNPEKILIKNINFEVKQGQKIAIVGATGAGKTTLINLLMRFYEINEGKIRLDEIDTKELTRSNLRSNFGMVLQDTWLFEGTIAENIAYGNPNATREEIVKAAQMARIDFFIRTMPKGYDTILMNGAENISVGQKQLLTIARVMLCNPSVLILDEATSSVDTRTEMEIGKAMDTLMKNRTSFVIAHRLSTIMDADLILVMKDGNVIEQGNHQELLNEKGDYAELYYSQFA